jgi:hypothetical protein
MIRLFFIYQVSVIVAAGTDRGERVLKRPLSSLIIRINW